MPEYPYFEDIFDATDQFIWTDFDPLSGDFWPLDDSQVVYHKRETRDNAGSIIGVTPAGESKRWPFRGDVSYEVFLQLRRWFIKGAFNFNPEPSGADTYKVKWLETAYPDTSGYGDRRLVSFTLQAIRE